MDLNKLVLDKIAALGDTEAAKYFEVSVPTISAWKLGRTMPKIMVAQKVLDEMPALVAVVDPELALLKAENDGLRKIIDEGSKAVAPVIEEVWEEPAKANGAVTLLMPIYNAMEPLTFITLLRCMKFYGMEKVSVIPMCRTLIDEARNNLVQKFLKTQNEWCVFIDADMVLPCGDGNILRKMELELPEPKSSRNALVRLMSHPKEARIVGALYKNRRGSGKPAVEIAYRSQAEEARIRGFFDGTTKTDGLEETGWIGFGLVRIHRSVFMEMQEAAKRGGLLAEIAPPVGREGDAFGYFGRTAQWRGEDISFCRRAQKIGIKTYADTGLLCGHQGQHYNLL